MLEYPFVSAAQKGYPYRVWAAIMEERPLSFLPTLAGTLLLLVAMAGGKENAAHCSAVGRCTWQPKPHYHTLSHTQTRGSINSRGQSQRVIDMGAKRRLQLQLQRGGGGGARWVSGMAVQDSDGRAWWPRRNWMRVQNAFSNTTTMATTMQREMQMQRHSVQIHTYTGRNRGLKFGGFKN